MSIFSWFLKVSPYFRALAVVYGICLLVAFQFSPTNQIIMSYEVGITLGWLLGVALTVSAARVGVLLHRVRKQTVSLLKCFSCPPRPIHIRFRNFDASEE